MMTVRLLVLCLLAITAASCGGQPSAGDLQVEGRLSVVVEDGTDGTVRMHYTLEADGADWPLQLRSRSRASSPAAPTSSRAAASRLAGSWSGDYDVIERAEEELSRSPARGGTGR